MIWEQINSKEMCFLDLVVKKGQRDGFGIVWAIGELARGTLKPERLITILYGA